MEVFGASIHSSTIFFGSIILTHAVDWDNGGPKDWEASSPVRSRTGPGIVPEVKALEIPTPVGHVVLLVWVEDSLETSHEVPCNVCLRRR
jgi:hypothetical protein